MPLHWRGFECGLWMPGDRVAFDAKNVTCWRCRWHRDEPKRASARRRAERQRQVRQPPRPRFAGNREGRCQLCGEPVEGRRRTWCSDRCVSVWWLATSSRVQFDYLCAEFGPVCWGCWDEPGVEVDHRRPLWSLTDRERTELRWWLPFNLQLLGRKCHRAKTSREARQRALERRGRRSG